MVANAREDQLLLNGDSVITLDSEDEIYSDCDCEECNGSESNDYQNQNVVLSNPNLTQSNSGSQTSEQLQNVTSLSAAQVPNDHRQQNSKGMPNGETASTRKSTRIKRKPFRLNDLDSESDDDNVDAQEHLPSTSSSKKNSSQSTSVKRQRLCANEFSKANQSKYYKILSLSCLYNNCSLTFQTSCKFYDHLAKSHSIRNKYQSLQFGGGGDGESNEPIKCTKCDSIFKNKNSIIQHLRYAHEGKLDSFKIIIDILILLYIYLVIYSWQIPLCCRR